jgi:hypothetical protein
MDAVVVPTLVLANRPRSCNKALLDCMLYLHKALSLPWVPIEIMLKSFVLTARTLQYPQP